MVLCEFASLVHARAAHHQAREPVGPMRTHQARRRTELRPVIAAATLHGKVEATLRHVVPEVERVEAVEAASLGAACEEPEKVSVEEHMRRLAAEGAATSIEWRD